MLYFKNAVAEMDKFVQDSKEKASKIEALIPKIKAQIEGGISISADIDFSVELTTDSLRKMLDNAVKIAASIDPESTTSMAAYRFISELAAALKNAKIPEIGAEDFALCNDLIKKYNLSYTADEIVDALRVFLEFITGPKMDYFISFFNCSDKEIVEKLKSEKVSGYLSKFLTILDPRFEKTIAVIMDFGNKVDFKDLLTMAEAPVEPAGAEVIKSDTPVEVIKAEEVAVTTENAAVNKVVSPAAFNPYAFVAGGSAVNNTANVVNTTGNVVGMNGVTAVASYDLSGKNVKLASDTFDYMTKYIYGCIDPTFVPPAEIAHYVIPNLYTTFNSGAIKNKFKQYFDEPVNTLKMLPAPMEELGVFTFFKFSTKLNTMLVIVVNTNTFNIVFKDVDQSTATNQPAN